MTFSTSEGAENSLHPLVQEQLDRLVENNVFDNRLKQYKLLRRLLEPTIIRRLKVGSSSSDILAEIYGPIHGRGDGDTFQAAKKRVQELRQQLKNYYDTVPVPKDPLKITIPEGGYWIKLEPDPYATAGSGEVDKTRNGVPVPLAFKQFFGINDVAGGGRGQIILQADRIEEQIGDLIPDLIDVVLNALAIHGPGDQGHLKLSDLDRERLKENRYLRAQLVHKAITGDSRLFKARTWINKLDIEGAEAVRTLFHDHGIDGPNLSLRAHSGSEPGARPFQIATGLGFTDPTERLIKDEDVFGPWLHVGNGVPWGDALYLDERVLRDDIRERLTSQASDEKPSGVHLKRVILQKDGATPHSVRVLPHQWKEDYSDQWWRKLESPGKVELWDYAIILRHTNEDDPSKGILFVLAGFTDHGTAVAGRYLAANFKNIHERFFTNDPDVSLSLGDFLMIIAGPACPDKNELMRWREDPDLPAITPKILHNAGIDCDWARRFGRKAQ